MYNNIEIKNIYDGVKYTKNKIKIQKTRVLTFFFFGKKTLIVFLMRIGPVYGFLFIHLIYTLCFNWTLLNNFMSKPQFYVGIFVLKITF